MVRSALVYFEQLGSRGAVEAIPSSHFNLS